MKHGFLIAAISLLSFSLFGLDVSEFSIPFDGGAIVGTLTEVDDTKRHRVIVLIAGSGPTDRDGNSFLIDGKNNSLKYLAEDLTDVGTAVFRYDKPGIGASEISTPMQDILFSNMVAGALACVRFLKTQGFSQVIVAGHSEGSLIGMLTATEVSGFISLLGPCKSAGEILKDQLHSQTPETFARIVEKLDSLTAGFPVANDLPGLSSLFNEQVQPYLISWMQYSPCEVFRELAIPTLVLQGTADLQVPVQEGRCLADCQPNADYHELPYMNHVMKIVTSPEENTASYGDPSMDLHPNLVPVIKSFLQAIH